MTTSLDLASTLTNFARRGFALVVSPSGSLLVRPASLLDQDDREWLRSHTSAVIKYLTRSEKGSDSVAITGTEPWDKTQASSLMEAADALVEKLGVSGQHPNIAAAAAMVSSAYATRDLETVRFACAEFIAAAREVGVAKRKSHSGG